VRLYFSAFCENRLRCWFALNSLGPDCDLAGPLLVAVSGKTPTFAGIVQL